MTDKERKSETGKKPEPAADAGSAAADKKAEAAPAKPSESGWSADKTAELTAAEFEKLSKENEELKDRVMRTMAEMENMRRRTERDKAETIKYAISNFARDVLSVGDNMRRAIGSVPANAAEQQPALKTLLEGVEMTERELLQVMERHGITRLEPKGERFDPNVHQAMFEIEDPSVEAGTIVELVQAGYKIADRILRPAMVGIAKGGAKPAKAETPSEGAKDPPDDKKGAEAEKPTAAEAKPAAEVPAAANDDAPAKAAAAKPRQGQKTPLPDPSRAPGSARRDAGKTKPGDRRPVGRHVDKSA